MFVCLFGCLFVCLFVSLVGWLVGLVGWSVGCLFTRNRGGVAFSLHFVCVCVFLSVCLSFCLCVCVCVSVCFVNRLQDAFLRTVATNANALQDRLLAVSIRFRLYVWLVA